MHRQSWMAVRKVTARSKQLGNWRACRQQTGAWNKSEWGLQTLLPSFCRNEGLFDLCPDPQADCRRFRRSHIHSLKAFCQRTISASMTDSVGKKLEAERPPR